MRFKKGSLEAKKYMAKIRAKRGKKKTTKKSIGDYSLKFVEAKKSVKPRKNRSTKTRTYKVTRDKKGHFKKMTKISGYKKTLTGLNNNDIIYKGYTIKKYDEGYLVLDEKGHDIVGEYLPNLKLAKSAINDEIDINNIGRIKKLQKKSPIRSLHKDIKSHNVNIRVMSGLEKTKFYL